MLIHDFMISHNGVDVSYSAVVNDVRGLTKGEVYCQLLIDQGKEARIESGY